MPARIVQARIDEPTQRLLARLRRSTGLTDSELVRKGLALLGETRKTAGARKIRGLGRFESGCRDLGSNKAHLGGFGKS